MAEFQTPSGQVVQVPDWLAGQLGGGPAPLQVATPEFGVLGSTAPPPQPLPPPPPPPPQRIGQGGGVVEEWAGPTPDATMPSPFGSGIVMPGEQPPMPQPTMAAPDIPSALPTAKERKATAAQQRAEATRAAQQAAFAASPEGKLAESERAALEANRQQQQIAAAGGNIQAREAADVSALKDASLARSEDIRKNQEAADAYRQKGIAQASKEREDAVNAEANYKIDDNRRWHNLSTGRKVLAGISVALSGLGDALMRKTGPNMALGIITGAIKDDVEAQVREREQLGKRIGIKQSSLDNYRRMAADATEAGQLKMAEEYKRTAQQVDAAASRYGSDKAKLAAGQLSAELNAKAGEIIGRYGEAAYQRQQDAIKTRQAQQQIGIAGGNLALNREQFKYQKERDKDQNLIELAKVNAKADGGGLGGTVTTVLDKDGRPKLDERGQPVLTVEQLVQPGGKAFEPEKEEKAKLIAERTGVQSLYDVLSQVKEHRDKYGGASSKTSPTAQAEYDRLVNKAVFAWAAANHLSTSDKESFDKARDAIFGADPSLYNISDVEGRIDRTLTEEREKYYSHLQGAGYRGPLPKFFDPATLPKSGVSADDAGVKDALGQEGNFRSGPAKTVFDNAVRIANEGTGKAKQDAVQLLMTLYHDTKSGAVRSAAQAELYGLGIDAASGKSNKLALGRNWTPDIPTIEDPSSIKPRRPAPIETND